MSVPRLETRHESTGYISYVFGFVLSIGATLLAYWFVTNHFLPKEALVYTIMAIAVVQLIIQAVFFLHIGRGSRWKFLTFIFAILIVIIVVGGSIWIMNNLDYNMMRMTPEQQQIYMEQHEGI